MTNLNVKPNNIFKRREADKRYRHTLNGLIRRSYHKMKARVNGKCKNPEIYKGLHLLPMEDFLDFCNNFTDLKRLHENWVKSGYDIKFTPSVDRIEENEGYILGNIRWITHIENSKRASMKYHHGIETIPLDILTIT